MRQTQHNRFGTGAHFFIGGIFSSLSNERMSPVLFMLLLPLLALAQQPPAGKTGSAASAITETKHVNTNPNSTRVNVSTSKRLNLSTPQQHSTTVQQSSTTIQPLFIGDHLPDITLPNVINTPGPLRLSAFRGRVLILDFWATWCTACIKNMPRVDSLQQQFGGRLQVLLVNPAYTRDTREKITAFLRKRNLRQPVAAEDTVLCKLFPHTAMPHYVWIDGSGVVKAFTTIEEITAANITAMLSGQTPAMRIKKDDLAYDRAKPLFTAGNGGNGESVPYRVLFSRYIDGLPTGSARQTDAARRITLLRFTNTSVLQLYRVAYDVSLPDNRIVLRVPHRQQLTPEGSWHTWKWDNAWCYERIGPAEPFTVVRQKMQAHLADFFGYEASFSTGEYPCWVLQAAPGGVLPLSGSGTPSNNFNDPDTVKYMRNRPLSKLVDWLNEAWEQPLLDETGCTGGVDLELPANLYDPTAVGEALARQGLVLSRTTRCLTVFVIAEPSGKK